jgi:carbonic anhydrase
MVPEGGGAHWGYSGEVGPPRWGRLRPEFAACSTGRRQSPIDLGPATRQDLVDIQFDYRGAAAAIVNNGHTIQVDLDPGSSIGVDGVRYELAQFHFHVPSEHTVGGQAAPAEVHLVHSHLSKSAQPARVHPHRAISLWLALKSVETSRELRLRQAAEFGLCRTASS